MSQKNTRKQMGVEPKIGGFYPPKMDGEKFIMENPMNKWMIWGYHYFWKRPDMESKIHPHKMERKTPFRTFIFWGCMLVCSGVECQAESRKLLQIS